MGMKRAWGGLLTVVILTILVAPLPAAAVVAETLPQDRVALDGVGFHLEGGELEITPSVWGAGGAGEGLGPVVAPSVSGPVTPAGGSLESADGLFEASFGAGAVDDDLTLTIAVPGADVPPHAGMIRIGDRVYDVTLEDDEGNPVTDFAGPLTLSFNFTAADLGGIDPADLRVFCFDEDFGAWVALPGIVDAGAGTVTATTDHLTLLALMHKEGMPRLLDVRGHWAEVAVLKLVSLDIISGYDDGTFRPAERVTREQFAKMVVLAMGLAPVAAPGPAFDDAGDISPWAAGYVQAAVEAEIIYGMDGNRFCPQAPVDRAQAAVMLIRALKIRPAAASTTFADDPAIPAWARGHVVEAAKRGIVTGFEDNTYRADLTCDRAQAAAMIARFLAVP
jgi:hypothetical protein